MAHSPVSSCSLSNSDQVEEASPISTDSGGRSREVLRELSPLAYFRHIEGIRPCRCVSVFLGGQEGKQRRKEERERGGWGDLLNYCMNEQHMAEQKACVNSVHFSFLPPPAPPT